MAGISNEEQGTPNIEGRRRFAPYISFKKKRVGTYTVYGILEDDQGCLWLSTNKGLSRFNPSTGVFKNYDHNSGLQGYEFNLGAYYKSQRGEMFFGGVDGLNAFYPDQMEDNLNIPPVLITKFKRMNQPVGIGGDFSKDHHYTALLGHLVV